MITFPNTHTTQHLSSSIAKVGWLLYQNKMETNLRTRLGWNGWNATEVTYKAYNLHNK